MSILKTEILSRKTVISHPGSLHGYAVSVVLKDGNLLTVYYARPGKDAPSEIIQLNWKYRFEE
ncbi:MAG: hypothetical protein J5794_02185 [Lachnospiraceae bacterium]|nr:hypothetical protein [Lachnospiraceae bacterium]